MDSQPQTRLSKVWFVARQVVKACLAEEYELAAILNGSHVSPSA